MKIQISWLLQIYTVCKGRVYPGSAGQGLNIYKYISIYLNITRGCHKFCYNSTSHSCKEVGGYGPSFHSTVIRFAFSKFIKTVIPITKRVFKQSRTRKEKKIRIHMLDFLFYLFVRSCTTGAPVLLLRVCRYNSELHANSHFAPCYTLIPNFASFAGNTT